MLRRYKSAYKLWGGVLVVRIGVEDLRRLRPFRDQIADEAVLHAREGMIDQHDLPISRQAEALGVSRGAVYYKPLGQPRPRICGSCAASTNCISTTRFGQPDCLRDFLNREGVSPCNQPDEAHRDRGHLSPSEHQQTRARPQDLPVSAARGEDRMGRSSVGDGHQCAAASGVRDEGRSLAIGLQERVANHRKRRKSPGRERYGKGVARRQAAPRRSWALCVPTELYEAAELDGANAWSRFLHVTVPTIRPVILIVIVMNTINGIKVFDQIWVMTAGGPNYASATLGTYLYSIAFGAMGASNSRLGYATAIAIVILLLSIAVSVIQIRLGRRPDVDFQIEL